MRCAHQPACAQRQRRVSLKSLSLSAWRVWGLQEDPLAFSGGVKLHWRIAEYINFKLPSPKCFINEPNVTAGDKSLGGAPTTVTSYVWVYTW